MLTRATFDELFDSVVEGKADRALVPIENSACHAITRERSFAAETITAGPQRRLAPEDCAATRC